MPMSGVYQRLELNPPNATEATTSCTTIADSLNYPFSCILTVLAVFGDPVISGNAVLSWTNTAEAPGFVTNKFGFEHPIIGSPCPVF